MRTPLKCAWALVLFASGDLHAADELARAQARGPMTEGFNKLSGKDDFRLALAVDSATGNLFISRWFTGVWMSSDQGQPSSGSMARKSAAAARSVATR